MPIKYFYFLPVLLLSIVTVAQQKPVIRLTSNARVETILKKMTLAQKEVQLQIRSYSVIEKFVDKDGNVDTAAVRKAFPNGLGGLNLDFNFEPEKYVKVSNQLQAFSLTAGAGIPMLFVGEGLHGYEARGATVFPQAIALGCTWDTVLAEKIFTVAGKEARTRGVRQLLSPVLDLAREPRFGRTEEFYSEDPYLVAMLGTAAVNGFQGRSTRPDQYHVAATLKHFVGHGQPEGGRNTAPINVSTYDLLNDHLFPFEMVIKNAHPLSVMPSYNEFDGIPNHGSAWLMKDILRDKLQFKGLVTSDQNAVDEMYRQHSIVATAGDAAALAISNMVDVDLEGNEGTFSTISSIVQSGKLPLTILDNSVRRFLQMKLALGLLDDPFSDAERMKAVTNTKENKALALEAAQKAMVLLKNDKALLPLNADKLKTVAVIGPLAKGVHFGGYSAEPRIGTDVLDGVTNFAQGRFAVTYAEGCKLAKEEASFWQDNVQTPNSEADDRRLIKEAVTIAAASDVIILAIGETEAFSREAWGESHRGDRTAITLLGLQNDLVKELLATGKPIVVVMFGGRPLVFTDVANHVPAIIQAFYLGQQTGEALANVIFGSINPSGKLSVTMPKSVGELPDYYDRKPSRIRSYVNEENARPFPFGFGLSYTGFEYGIPKTDKKIIGKKESIKVSQTVKNMGNMQGDEIVQLYIRDKISSGVRPVMELKDFARVSLAPGETKLVTFTITPDKLMYYNPQQQKVLEPGDFTIMIGRNSQDVQSVDFTVK